MATNTEMIVKIATGVAVIEKTVMGLEKAVMGNGKKGLLDRVTEIENRHCNEDEDEKEYKEINKKAEEENKEIQKEVKAKKATTDARFWAVALVFITQFVAQFIALIILFIKTGLIK